MKKVAEEYDIFINMSRADAQVTTVLEAMCWGFPVACTRQSGYSEEESIFYLELFDTERTMETLKKLQEMESAELARIAAENRKIAAEKYTWEHFVTTIRDKVVSDIDQGG
jgi:glycosyltransferase involved in cell wall biosynthesis